MGEVFILTNQDKQTWSIIDCSFRYSPEDVRLLKGPLVEELMQATLGWDNLQERELVPFSQA